MDDDTGRDIRPGGNVKPLSRPSVAKQLFQAPRQAASERYELRDPFAEVTHRAKTFDEMVVTANRVGAIKFTAIAADGKRSTVFKVNGSWQRGDRVPQPATPVREDPQPAPNVVPLAAVPVNLEASSPKVDAQAQRKARVSQLEAALNERYVIKRAPIRIGDVTIGQTEYRHRGDTTKIAFTESTFRLSTDNNSPSVARSMVDVAEARNWQALRVSGNEDFKRMVWLEATLREVKTIGYEPLAVDLQLLRKEREARQVNRIEPLAGQTPSSQGPTTTKESARGNGGRKAVLAALEAVLVAQRIPESQREAVMIAAAENLAQRLRNGETHRVKVWDRSAPVQRPTVKPTREVERTRERGAPAR